LVDLALTAGHVAIMLNLVPRTTWGELIPIRLEDIDRDVLNQVVLIHPSGTHVLSAPRRADQRELLTSEKISKVLGLLKKSYSYVVLDLPHSTDELTLEALDQADEILLVLAPELASVVSASSALEIFDNLGYPKNKIRLVLNYITDRQDLGLAIVEEAVKRPINVIVPCAPDIVVAAINKGAPFVVDKFNTPIGSILEDLAFLMSKDEDRNKRPYKPSPMWERATHRFQQRKKK
jgi:pilus assembly protein CpaE